MKRMILACLCLAMVTTVGTADEDLQSKVKAFFQKFDANQDGTVTSDEFPNDRIFKRLDTNSDGKITSSDFGASPNADKPDGSDRPENKNTQRPDGPKAGGDWMKRFDRNRDGKLTRAEMRGHEGLFHQLDSNNNNELDGAEASKITQDQLRGLTRGGGDNDMDGSRGDRFDQGKGKDQNRRNRRGGGRNPWQRMMQHGDTNGDGKLSQKEWVAMQKDQFEQMDKNGDGSVSEQEMRSHMESRMRRGRRGREDGKKPEGSRENPRGGGENDARSKMMAKRVFERMDKNGDGSLSKEETPERMPFDQVDSDGDGKISQAEFTKSFAEQMRRRGGQEQRPGNRKRRGQGQDGDKKGMDRPGGDNQNRGGDRAAKFFTRMDKNGDGKITKDEAPDRLKQAFDRFDADGDGSITKEELSKAFERRGQRGKREKRDN